MSHISHRLKIVVATLALAPFALVLVGCSGGNAGSYSGLPPEEDIAQSSDTADTGVQAFWLNDGANIAVAIWGSSTCPYVGTSIEVVEKAGEGNTVAIEVPPLPDKPCTMDYVPHTSVFSTPGQVTTTEPLEIQVNDQVVVLPIK